VAHSNQFVSARRLERLTRCSIGPGGLVRTGGGGSPRPSNRAVTAECLPLWELVRATCGCRTVLDIRNQSGALIACERSRLGWQTTVSVLSTLVSEGVRLCTKRGRGALTCQGNASPGDHDAHRTATCQRVRGITGTGAGTCW
jgi:hypothetical protein